MEYWVDSLSKGPSTHQQRRTCSWEFRLASDFGVQSEKVRRHPRFSIFENGHENRLFSSILD